MFTCLLRSLGWEDPLKKEMTIHSSILAWRIPWTEEPGGPQSIGLQRVRHDWSDLTCIYLNTQKFVVCLKFKFTQVSCVLRGCMGDTFLAKAPNSVNPGLILQFLMTAFQIFFLVFSSFTRFMSRCGFHLYHLGFMTLLQPVAFCLSSFLDNSWLFSLQMLLLAPVSSLLSFWDLNCTHFS